MNHLIWHPFTQHQLDPDPVVISSGEGAYLFSESGDRYIDAISSWWCNLHGHAHPVIADAIAKQAHTLEHVLFAGFSHPPAKQLAHNIAQILPQTCSKLFFSDNGSTAIEVAIKIAIQFFKNQNINKHRIVKLKHGYHGDTIGAMSVSDTTFSSPFRGLLFNSLTLTPPYPACSDQAIEEATQLFKDPTIAAFIYEPILQGAGGMKVYQAEAFETILQLAKQHHIICIADEILTGFGRTGPLFASEFMKTQPDILCISKGLTGGFLPLAITATSEEIYSQFLSQNRIKALLHGHTYTANPLGCAAALSSLQLTLSPECEQKRNRIAFMHQQYQKQYGHLWSRCEVLGTILILDIPTEQHDAHYFSSLRDKLLAFFLKKKIILRPLGNTLYVLPPYCIKQSDLEYIYQSLNEVAKLV